MLEGLIGFLVLALVVVVVAWIIIKVIEMGLKQEPALTIARLLVVIVALLVLVSRGLPMIGVNVPF